jgi:hypothetical protein
MLRIKLGARRYVGDAEADDDFLPREHAGWDPTLTDDQVFEAARGWWRLSEKAEDEKFAVVVCGDTVRLVAAIDGWATRDDGRRAFRGRILQPGHEVYDRFAGQPDPVATASRNPVAYFADQADLGLCRCGCKERTRGDWAMGHDQRAIHRMIGANFKNVAEFLEWCRTQGLKLA